MTLSILVVDDHGPSRHLVRFLLERRGHRICEAASLSEARARMAEGPFDVVLLDLFLPDGNGDSLLPELRALEPGPAVVALSADFTPDTARRPGFDGALCKPVDIARFPVEVERFAAERTTGSAT